MARPRTHADRSPAARMRRSRAALAARGGRLVQLRLDADARRALAALELTSPAASRAEVTAKALGELAARRRFPVRLSRDDEVRIAALANGPFTPAAFRATGFDDAFLAAWRAPGSSMPRSSSAGRRRRSRTTSGTRPRRARICAMPSH